MSSPHPEGEGEARCSSSPHSDGGSRGGGRVVNRDGGGSSEGGAVERREEPPPPVDLSIPPQRAQTVDPTASPRPRLRAHSQRRVDGRRLEFMST